MAEQSKSGLSLFSRLKHKHKDDGSTGILASETKESGKLASKSLGHIPALKDTTDPSGNLSLTVSQKLEHPTESRSEIASIQAGEKKAMDVNIKTSAAIPDLLGSMGPIHELWSYAYDSLKETEPDLVQEYEGVLCEDLRTMVAATVSFSGSKVGRQEQMAAILKRKVAEAQKNAWRLKFGSKDVPVKDLMEPIVSIVDWADNYISDALSANPYASIAWAGVGFLLPLFLNPSKQAASLVTGLDYMADLIVRSSMRENLYARRYGTNDNGQAFLSSHLAYRDTLKELYTKILKFQAKSICYFSKNGAFRLGLDLVKWNDWDSALVEIQTQETAFRGVYDIWKDTRDQEESEALYRNHKENLGIMRSLSGAVSGLRKAVDDAQKDGRRTGLLGWLSSSDPSTNFNSSLEKREMGTSDWLVKDNGDYKQWKKSPNSLLWLNGQAGAGKSVLSSAVISNLKREHKSDPETALAFFYFSFNDAKKQNAAELLASLIKQLCCYRPDTPEAVQELRQYQEKGQRPDIETLQDTLAATIHGFSNIYIIIDGLDESPYEGGERRKTLSCLRKFHQAKFENLHMFCTSRREVDIEAIIEPLIRLEKNIDMDLSVYKDAINHDIGLYIDKTFASVYYDSWPNKVKSEARAALLKNANGMFQYTSCQFEVLQKLSTPGSIRKALKDLPKGLDSTYDRILQNIDLEYVAQVTRTLKFLAFSWRTLTLGEIAEIFILDPASEVPFDEDNRLFKASDVLKYLPGLVTKITTYSFSTDEQGIYSGPLSSHQELEEDDTDSEVVFTHFSVKEYLLSKRISQGPAKAFSIVQEEAELYITEACLAYHIQLSKSHLPDMSTSREYLFWDYAANFSLSHLEHINQSSWTPAVIKFAKQLLAPSSKPLANLVEIHPVDGGRATFAGRFDEVPAPLYYTCSLGLYLLSSYLIDQGADVNEFSPGAMYGTALQATAWHGHKKILNLLFEKGADLSFQGGYYGNPLQAVCAQRAYHNNIDIVELLLAKGINVNIQDGYFGNALQASVNGGNQKITNLLLEKGADILAKGGVFGNTLRAAIARYQLSFALKLVGMGATLGGEDDDWDDMFGRVKKAFGQACGQRLREARGDVMAYIERDHSVVISTVLSPETKP